MHLRRLVSAEFCQLIPPVSAVFFLFSHLVNDTYHHFVLDDAHDDDPDDRRAYTALRSMRTRKA
jgi:hypothetical protein